MEFVLSSEFKLMRKLIMEKEFLEWYKENENRLYQSQLDAKEVSYAAWIEGKKKAVQNCTMKLKMAITDWRLYGG